MNRVACYDISNRPWLTKAKLPGHFFQVKRLGEISKRSNVGNAIVIATDSLSEIKDLPIDVQEILKSSAHCTFLVHNIKDAPRKCIFDFLFAGFLDVIQFIDSSQLDVIIQQRSERQQKIKKILESPLVTQNLIGRNSSWLTFLYQVIESAIFSDSNILLTGESGTGKELVSRLIHTVDTKRSKYQMVIVDCTTLIAELSGSELFGHEKGAYTNALNSREGAFSLANNGTLFLDEIGDLPLNMQAELLRVVQEGKFKKVGSNTWESTNVRLVCATNRNLRKMVEDGQFRADLFYRLSGFELKTIPLRERKSDIPLLLDSFTKEFIRDNQIDGSIQFASDLISYLMEKEYPGNIRELKQLVNRMLMKHHCAGWVTLGDLAETDREQHEKPHLKSMLSEWEFAIKQSILKGDDLSCIKNFSAYLAIKMALELEEGNKTRAAQRLNVTLRSIQQFNKKNGSERMHA